MITDYVDRLTQSLRKIDHSDISKIAGLIRRSQAHCGTVWIFGNGGSFANAQHWACDLLKVATIRCGVLGSNIPILTAFSNDVSYDESVALEFRRVARYGDLLVVLSCSGCSPNVIRLFMEASRIHLSSILVTGSIQTIVSQASMTIRIQSDDYGVIEDCHSVIGHILSEELSRSINQVAPIATSFASKYGMKV